MDGLTSTQFGGVELCCDSPRPKSSVSRESKPYSSLISLDTDKCLTPHVRAKFNEVHLKYDDVFSPRFRRYNGASGPIEGVVNMGSTLPTQRKGKLPDYNKDTLDILLWNLAAGKKGRSAYLK